MTEGKKNLLRKYTTKYLQMEVIDMYWLFSK